MQSFLICLPRKWNLIYKWKHTMYFKENSGYHRGRWTEIKLFKKVPKNAQNVLDPLLSLYVYFFISKVLLKDQKMLNLKRKKKWLKRTFSPLCYVFGIPRHCQKKIMNILWRVINQNLNHRKQIKCFMVWVTFTKYLEAQIVKLLEFAFRPVHVCWSSMLS